VWVSVVVLDEDVRSVFSFDGARRVDIYRYGVGLDLVTRDNYSSEVDVPPPERGPV